MPITKTYDLLNINGVKGWVRDSWARRAISKLISPNVPSTLCTVTPIVPTLEAGSHYANYGGCYYYKIGHRVHIHVGVGGLTSGSTTELWIMPQGYRPYTMIGTVGTGGSMTTYGRLRVHSDGKVTVNANAAYACVDVEYDAFQ